MWSNVTKQWFHFSPRKCLQLSKRLNPIMFHSACHIWYHNGRCITSQPTWASDSTLPPLGCGFFVSISFFFLIFAVSLEYHDIRCMQRSRLSTVTFAFHNLTISAPECQLRCFLIRLYDPPNRKFVPRKKQLKSFFSEGTRRDRRFIEVHFFRLSILIFKIWLMFCQIDCLSEQVRSTTSQ